MTTSLFIRTFHKDAPFLSNLFRSLDKFCTGFDEIVVHCDDADRRVIAGVVAGRAKLVSSRPECRTGYKNQQHVKASADRWCSGDIIQFLDSDCVATGPINPDHFKVDGKPQILFTPFAVLGSSVPWRPATEHGMGEPVEHEFMRGMRLGYWRDTLRGAREHLDRRFRSSSRFFDRTPNVSEFCYIGAWAWKNHHDRYSWLDTTKELLPLHNVRQFYSGAGVTPEIAAETERYLA